MSNREAIDTWLERGILGLVLATLVFGPLAFGGVRPSEFVVLQWLIVGALGLWLVRLWAAPQFRFLLPPNAWAILPFVAYGVWRYRTADIEYLARQEFIQVALAAVLFLIIVNNLYAQNNIRIIVVCLVTIGTLLAMHSVYQWLTGSQRIWLLERPGNEGRGSATYVCPNHLAGFLEMICPLAITCTVLRGYSIVPRILFGYAAFVMMVGIAITGSRGGWLATTVGMAVLTVILLQRRRHAWGALVVLILVIGTGTWFYSKALGPRLDRNPSSGKLEDIRLVIWQSAKQMWKDHWWTGVGPDHFDYRYRGYRLAHWSAQLRPGRTHNDYWNTLADWGMAGLILVLLPITVTAFGVVITWKYLQRGGEMAGNRVSVVLGCAIGMICLLVHSFFDFNMHIPANAFLATTLLSLIAAHWRFASQRFWLTARWPVRVIATPLLLGAGFYLGTQAFQHTKEALASGKAEMLPVASKEKITGLKKTFQIEPKNPDNAFAVGEELRLRAWNGEEDYKSEAREAIEWFERAAALNQWDPQSRIRIGMCLDWIGRHEEAEAHFKKALQLDPNHLMTRAMMGWHYFQIDNFAETCRWMEKTLELQGENQMARSYLELAKQAIAEQNNKGSIRRVPSPNQ